MKKVPYEYMSLEMSKVTIKFLNHKAILHEQLRDLEQRHEEAHQAYKTEGSSEAKQYIIDIINYYKKRIDEIKEIVK